MIFELSRDNLALAQQEVCALAKPKTFQCLGNLLICKANIDFSRLAYTNNVFEEIFLDTKIPNINWEKYYKGCFCVRSNITAKEKELASIIWHTLKNPKVNVKNPESEFHFFFIEEKIACGKKVYERQEKFQTRRPDLRPGFFPVSLKPKLARALVNLSGVKRGVIWDPFCGTGGILLETSLMKLKAVGTDIDPLMIRAAKQNFEHYACKAKLSIGDARKEVIKCHAIVTDPPYGRRASTKKEDREKLYKDFLVHVYPFVETVVLMAPNTINLKTNYKLIWETEEFVHGSLTRKIYLLKKTDKKKHNSPEPEKKLLEPRDHINNNKP